MRNRKEIEKRVFFPHSVCVRSYHPPLTLHASLRHLLSGNPFARTAHTGLFSDRWSKGTYEDAGSQSSALGKTLEEAFLSQNSSTFVTTIERNISVMLVRAVEKRNGLRMTQRNCSEIVKPSRSIVTAWCSMCVNDLFCSVQNMCRCCS